MALPEKQSPLDPVDAGFLIQAHGTPEVRTLHVFTKDAVWHDCARAKMSQAIHVVHNCARSSSLYSLKSSKLLLFWNGTTGTLSE